MATTESAGPFVGGGCAPPEDDGNLNLAFDDCFAQQPVSWYIAESSTTQISGNISRVGEYPFFDYVLNGLGTSYTAAAFQYPGYHTFVIICSNSKIVVMDRWVTQNGLPVRQFNHTYDNPCCDTKDLNNTIAIMAGAGSVVMTPNGITDAQFITRILQAAKQSGQSSAYYVELIKGFRNAGAVIDTNGVCSSIPKGKFFSSGAGPGQALNAGQKAVLESLKRKITELGGKIIKAKPKPRGGGSFTLPMIMPLPLMPGWNPATGRFDDGWTGACNDPGTLNPGVGTAILASTNGRNSINLANIYGPSMSPSLASNNHVINAFGGSPPTSFPIALVPKG